MTTRFRVHIPAPCGESWAELDGDGPQRHCARCDEHVHDLLALPPAAARRVLREGACIRMDLRQLLRRVAPAAALTVALTGCATTGTLEVTPLSAPYNGEAVAEPELETVLIEIDWETTRRGRFMGRRGH